MKKILLRAYIIYFAICINFTACSSNNSYAKITDKGSINNATFISKDIIDGYYRVYKFNSDGGGDYGYVKSPKDETVMLECSFMYKITDNNQGLQIHKYDFMMNKIGDKRGTIGLEKNSFNIVNLTIDREYYNEILSKIWK